ncbi:MAG: MFS transporter [Planctomycetes bacterium]|nr:MFS transporter [Planctomycetota bacterium]
MNSSQATTEKATLFGHPPGIFTLFFAEMWERFSYYGMRSLLVFYMIKGFLGYGDSDAYTVYGAYTALVYMTPFFGGILADRLLGARRAVVLGGLLMAAGHLMMTIENKLAFFTALALLILGNGFFKPNISAIVGSLYPAGSPKRDGGFTIFYMGINLGAAMSPLLCGYIGETYGWHYGFGLATIGMLVGVAVFVAPALLSQLALTAVAVLAAANIFFRPYLNEAEVLLCGVGLLALLVVSGGLCFVQLSGRRVSWSLVTQTAARIVIGVGAVLAAWGLIQYRPENPFSTGVNVCTAVSLLIAAVVAWVALGRGGVPERAGSAPDEDRLRRPVVGWLRSEWAVYAGTLAAVPVFALLVSGFALVTGETRAVSLIPEALITRVQSAGAAGEILAVVATEMSKPAGLVLMLCGLAAALYLLVETFRLDRVARERMFVVLILTFFSMLFWSFFEQAGSSVNNFTDRNVDRVLEKRHITRADVGSSIRMRIPPDTTDPELKKLPLLSQEQLGFPIASERLKNQIADAVRSEELRKAKLQQKELTPEELDDLVRSVSEEPRLTISALTYLRAAAGQPDATPQDKIVVWRVTEEHIGMGIGGSEIPASVLQAANPIYILLFGLAFTALWGFLDARGWEPSTPTKFSLGLLQLGLGFGAFWYGAYVADERGMTTLSWLLLGYLLQTTGELCLSPVGLSMVTKLSPPRLVSTVMGAWFLATAFSQFLAAIIAQFTGVEGGDGGAAVIPIPKETVAVYGSVFGKIALAAMISAGICFLLSPLLTRWMHSDEPA